MKSIKMLGLFFQIVGLVTTGILVGIQLKYLGQGHDELIRSIINRPTLSALLVSTFGVILEKGVSFYETLRPEREKKNKTQIALEEIMEEVKEEVKEEMKVKLKKELKEELKETLTQNLED
ncbi:hypothetical protein ACBZ92_02205 [Priestia aryabhattai]|uniref:hypothetical protein n=1 Tax=Priestia TaxID=2800373 RepID=UPI0021D66DC0|nr:MULTISPECIES: hypothetical protein [Priestia]MCU7712490.1 hypothetical protein [Priestia megaterium]MCW1046319.1 hypothetical protein [Priestia sp. JV24]